MAIDTKTGVMEIGSNVGKEIRNLIKLATGDHWRGKVPLVVTVVEESKHHGGVPMLVIHEDPGDDVSIHHIEISENGVFAYQFDDGAS